MTAREPIQVEAIYARQTRLAWGVRAVEGAPVRWLPKSNASLKPLATLFDDEPADGAVVEITAPEWLLTREGLI